MKNTFLLLLLISFFSLSGKSISDTLNHKVFIKKLRNSETELFQNVLKEYESLLSKNPNDIYHLIERCKFVNKAQFDEYYEYNPNQELADSLETQLVNRFPDHPEVIIFQTEQLWGDSLEKVLQHAKKLMKSDEEAWNDQQKSIIYSELSDLNYNNENYTLAEINIKKAIQYDSSLKKEIGYSKILVEIGDTAEAEAAILSNLDTAQGIWYLNQRANLLIRLKKYDRALEVFNAVQEADSTYIRNKDMASVFEGINRFDLARTYYVKDTVDAWQKEKAALNLFLHDLSHQPADSAKNSYNALRDLGFVNDPLALYRLQLFYHHPSMGWSARDIGAFILLILLFVFFILIPSVWILPVYFIGKHWEINPSFSLGNNWGLKAFWWVSVAYSIASLCSLLAVPQEIYYYFNDSSYSEELTLEQDAFTLMVFTVTAAIITLLSLFKTKLSVLYANRMIIGRVILITIGYFFLYKIASGIYLKMGETLFEYDPYELGFTNPFLLSSQPEIISLLKDQGFGISVLIVALLVPLYEEVMFRGVILESCTNYLTFRWANVFQSSLFALAHMDLYLLPVFFAFGIITGNMRKKTGGLFGGILFHVINNFLAVSVINSRLTAVDLFSFIGF